MSSSKIYIDRFEECARCRVPYDTDQPVEIVTQPHCALTLREIMQQFADGDVSVRSHLPTGDWFDESSDEEFANDKDNRVPHVPEDQFEAMEYVYSIDDTIVEYDLTNPIEQPAAEAAEPESGKEVSND